jgi:hypothetical protein
VVVGGGGGGGWGVGGLDSCVEGLGAAEVRLWEAVGGRRGWIKYVTQEGEYKQA